MEEEVLGDGLCRNTDVPAQARPKILSAEKGIRQVVGRCLVDRLLGLL